jgi:hypothetical protein
MIVEESIIMFLLSLKNSCFRSQLQLPTCIKQIRLVVKCVSPTVYWIEFYDWY